MLFVNENYKNYKYIVGVSDNYLVLTNCPSVNASYQNPQTIDIIYQYLNPSFLTVEGTRTYSSSTLFEQIETSQSFFARSDCLDLIVVQVILIFMILFFLNGLTKFVHKGGVFFGT